MSEGITTTDLYESTFYLMGGCELVGIEAQRVDGSITCRLTSAGRSSLSFKASTSPAEPRSRSFPSAVPSAR